MRIGSVVMQAMQQAARTVQQAAKTIPVAKQSASRPASFNQQVAKAKAQPIIRDMAAGKSIEVIAKAQGMTREEVIKQLDDAGYEITPTNPSSDVDKTEIRDEETGQVVATEYYDYQHDSYYIEASAPGGGLASTPVRDGKGRKVTTSRDPNTGAITTRYEDDLGSGSVIERMQLPDGTKIEKTTTKDGPVTEKTTLPNGVSTEKTTYKNGRTQTVVTTPDGKKTDLASDQDTSPAGVQPIVTEFGNGKSIDQIARDHGWTPEQVRAQLAAAGFDVKKSRDKVDAPGGANNGDMVESEFIVDQSSGQVIAKHSRNLDDGSRTTHFTDAGGDEVSTTKSSNGDVTEKVVDPEGRVTQKTTQNGQTTTEVIFNGFTLTTAPDGSMTLTYNANGAALNIAPGSEDEALAKTMLSVNPNSSDPAKAAEGQVVKAFAESYFLGKMAGQLEQNAADKQQAAEDAKQQYGEDSIQYQRAVAEQQVAEAQYLEVVSKSNEAYAQLQVYAADPAYSGAVDAADMRLDQALEPHGLEWRPPEPEGSLAEAQQNLATQQQITQKATAAVQEYQAGADALNQLPDDYVPGTEYQLPEMTVGDADGESTEDYIARQKTEHAQREKLYAGGVLHMANGNKLLADAGVLAGMPGAEDAQKNAEAIQAIAQGYYDVAGAKVEQTAFEGRALGVFMEQEENKHFFQPEGFTPPSTAGNYNGPTGDLKNYWVEVRNGQLWVVIKYENTTREFPLTYEPGKQPRNRTDAEKQIDQDWADLNENVGLNPDCAPEPTALSEANHQLVQAQKNANELSKKQLEELFPELKGSTPDAPASSNTPNGSGAQPVTDMSPLDQARQLYGQLQEYGEFLDFIMTQPLPNDLDPEEIERLKSEHRDDGLKSDPEAREEWGDEKTKTYGDPKAGEWKNPTRLTNIVGTALELQPTELGSVENADPNMSWYSGVTLEAIQPVVDKIREVTGGVYAAMPDWATSVMPPSIMDMAPANSGKVQVVPAFLVGKNGQVHHTALFVVTDRAGKKHFIDETGGDYDSLDHYREDHRLPGSGTLYYLDPEALSSGGQINTSHGGIQLASNSSGHPQLRTMEIEGEDGGWQAADATAGIVATGAGVASLIPGPHLLFTVPTAIVAGGYLGARSIWHLKEMSEQGRTWFSKEGMMSLAMVATSALPVASGVLRTGSQFRFGMSSVPAVRSGFGAMPFTGRFAPAYADDALGLLGQLGFMNTTAKVFDLAGMGIGIPMMGVSAYDLIKYGDQMSDLEQLSTVVDLLSGIHGTAMGIRPLLHTRNGGTESPSSRPAIVYKSGDDGVFGPTSETVFVDPDTVVPGEVIGVHNVVDNAPRQPTGRDPGATAIVPWKSGDSDKRAPTPRPADLNYLDQGTVAVNGRVVDAAAVEVAVPLDAFLVIANGDNPPTIDQLVNDITNPEYTRRKYPPGQDVVLYFCGAGTRNIAEPSMKPGVPLYTSLARQLGNRLGARVHAVDGDFKAGETVSLDGPAVTELPNLPLTAVSDGQVHRQGNYDSLLDFWLRDGGRRPRVETPFNAAALAQGARVNGQPIDIMHLGTPGGPSGPDPMSDLDRVLQVRPLTENDGPVLKRLETQLSRNPDFQKLGPDGTARKWAREAAQGDRFAYVIYPSLGSSLKQEDIGIFALHKEALIENNYIQTRQFHPDATQRDDRSLPDRVYEGRERSDAIDKERDKIVLDGKEKYKKPRRSTDLPRNLLEDETYSSPRRLQPTGVMSEKELAGLGEVWQSSTYLHPDVTSGKSFPKKIVNRAVRLKGMALFAREMVQRGEPIPPAIYARVHAGGAYPVSPDRVVQVMVDHQGGAHLISPDDDFQVIDIDDGVRHLVLNDRITGSGGKYLKDPEAIQLNGPSLGTQESLAGAGDKKGPIALIMERGSPYSGQDTRNVAIFKVNLDDYLHLDDNGNVVIGGAGAQSIVKLVQSELGKDAENGQRWSAPGDAPRDLDFRIGGYRLDGIPKGKDKKKNEKPPTIRQLIREFEEKWGQEYPTEALGEYISNTFNGRIKDGKMQDPLTDQQMYDREWQLYNRYLQEREYLTSSELAARYGPDGLQPPRKRWRWKDSEPRFFHDEVKKLPWWLKDAKRLDAEGNPLPLLEGEKPGKEVQKTPVKQAQLWDMRFSVTFRERINASGNDEPGFEPGPVPLGSQTIRAVSYGIGTRTSFETLAFGARLSLSMRSPTPLKAAASEALGRVVRPDEINQMTPYGWGAWPVLDWSVFPAFAGPLTGIAKNAFFGEPPEGWVIKLRSARFVEKTPDGEGYKVEVDYYPQAMAESVKLEKGEKDFFGNTAQDAPNGHVRLLDEIPYDRVIRDRRFSLPVVGIRALREWAHIRYGIPLPLTEITLTPGFEIRHEVKLDDVPGKGDIVPREWIELFNGPASRATMRLEVIVRPFADGAVPYLEPFLKHPIVEASLAQPAIEAGGDIVRDSQFQDLLRTIKDMIDEGQLPARPAQADLRMIEALKPFLDNPTVEAVREMARKGHIDTKEKPHPKDMDVKFYLPEGHNFHQTAIPGKDLTRTHTDRDGKKSQVPAEATNNQWGIVNNKKPDRWLSRFMHKFIGRESENVPQDETGVVSTPHTLPTPDDINISDLWFGRKHERAAKGKRITFAAVFPQARGAPMPLSYSAEPRPQLNIPAPAVAPVVHEMAIYRVSPGAPDGVLVPVWLIDDINQVLDGATPAIPKGGTKQIDTFLTALEAFPDQSGTVAQFRQKFRSGKKPVIRDNAFLRRPAAQEIVKLLPGLGQYIRRPADLNLLPQESLTVNKGHVVEDVRDLRVAASPHVFLVVADSSAPPSLDELVSYITSHPNYHPGKDVELYFCRAGTRNGPVPGEPDYISLAVQHDSLARQLGNWLGARVQAVDGDIELGATTILHGPAIIERPDLPLYVAVDEKLEGEPSNLPHDPKGRTLHSQGNANFDARHRFWMEDGGRGVPVEGEFNPTATERGAWVGNHPIDFRHLGTPEDPVSQPSLGRGNGPQPPSSAESTDALLQEVVADPRLWNATDYRPIYNHYIRRNQPQTWGSDLPGHETVGRYVQRLNETSQNRPQGFDPIEPSPDFLSFNRPNRYSATQRIFINVNLNRAGDLADFIAREIVYKPNEYPGVRMAKVPGPSQWANQRSDSAVIYIDTPENRQRVLNAFTDYWQQYPHHFMREVPPMTEPVLPGISLADHPTHEMTGRANHILGASHRFSFGSLRSEAIRLAIGDTVAMHGPSLDARTLEALRANVRQRFVQFGIDPDNPSRNLTQQPGEAAVWRPSANDMMLVVWSGDASRQPSEGEVFLNLSDFDQIEMSDDSDDLDGHFESVYFENVSLDALSETPQLAIGKVYRVLMPTGDVRITTESRAAFDENERSFIAQYAQHLEDAGFEQVEVVERDAGETRYFQFYADKPATPDTPGGGEPGGPGPHDDPTEPLGDAGTAQNWSASESPTEDPVSQPHDFWEHLLIDTFHEDYDPDNLSDPVIDTLHEDYDPDDLSDPLIDTLHKDYDPVILRARLPNANAYTYTPSDSAETVLFRGDSRSPEEIFRDGFTTEGVQVLPGRVSTSLSAEYARPYAWGGNSSEELVGRGGWLYTIVAKVTNEEIVRSLPGVEGFQGGGAVYEIPFTNGILPENILAARKVGNIVDFVGGSAPFVGAPVYNEGFYDPAWLPGSHRIRLKDNTGKSFKAVVVGPPPASPEHVYVPPREGEQLPGASKEVRPKTHIVVWEYVPTQETFIATVVPWTRGGSDTPGGGEPGGPGPHDPIEPLGDAGAADAEHPQGLMPEEQQARDDPDDADPSLMDTVIYPYTESRFGKDAAPPQTGAYFGTKVLPQDLESFANSLPGFHYSKLLLEVRMRFQSGAGSAHIIAQGNLLKALDAAHAYLQPQTGKIQVYWEAPLEYDVALSEIDPSSNLPKEVRFLASSLENTGYVEVTADIMADPAGKVIGCNVSGSKPDEAIYKKGGPRTNTFHKLGWEMALPPELMLHGMREILPHGEPPSDWPADTTTLIVSESEIRAFRNRLPAYSEQEYNWVIINAPSFEKRLAVSLICRALDYTQTGGRVRLTSNSPVRHEEIIKYIRVFNSLKEDPALPYFDKPKIYFERNPETGQIIMAGIEVSITSRPDVFSQNESFETKFRETKDLLTTEEYETRRSFHFQPNTPRSVWPISPIVLHVGLGESQVRFNFLVHEPVQDYDVVRLITDANSYEPSMLVSAFGQARRLLVNHGILRFETTMALRAGEDQIEQLSNAFELAGLDKPVSMVDLKDPGKLILEAGIRSVPPSDPPGGGKPEFTGPQDPKSSGDSGIAGLDEVPPSDESEPPSDGPNGNGGYPDGPTQSLSSAYHPEGVGPQQDASLTGPLAPFSSGVRSDAFRAADTAFLQDAISRGHLPGLEARLTAAGLRLGTAQQPDDHAGKLDALPPPNEATTGAEGPRGDREASRYPGPMPITMPHGWGQAARRDGLSAFLDNLPYPPEWRREIPILSASIADAERLSVFGTEMTLPQFLLHDETYWNWLHQGVPSPVVIDIDTPGPAATTFVQRISDKSGAEIIAPRGDRPTMWQILRPKFTKEPLPGTVELSVNGEMILVRDGVGTVIAPENHFQQVVGASISKTVVRIYDKALIVYRQPVSSRIINPNNQIQKQLETGRILVERGAPFVAEVIGQTTVENNPAVLMKLVREVYEGQHETPAGELFYSTDISRINSNSLTSLRAMRNYYEQEKFGVDDPQFLTDREGHFFLSDYSKIVSNDRTIQALNMWIELAETVIRRRP